MDSPGISALIDLGLSRLQAKIYTFLLRESPSTGYRIAQALGKTAPSIYKTIEFLEHEGMVIVDDGDVRLCRVVPPDEVLARLEREFKARKNRVAAALENVHAQRSDDRVYALRSLDQILEKCRSMIGGALQMVTLDATPGPLSALRPDLESAASRGVKITVKIYQPVEISGVETVQDYRGDLPAKQGIGGWINLVADASEHLISRLSTDGKEVLQAVWSGSPYLSWVYFTGVESEIAIDRVMNLLTAGGNAAQVMELLAGHRREELNELHGYQRQVERSQQIDLQERPEKD